MSKDKLELIEKVKDLPEDMVGPVSRILNELIYIWDPDFVKSTPSEMMSLLEADGSGYVNEEDIDWEHLEQMNLG